MWLVAARRWSVDELRNVCSSRTSAAGEPGLTACRAELRTRLGRFGSRKGWAMAETGAAVGPRTALRRALLPLALAQFICSLAGSNMNVMINDISKDLDTTVQGVQVAITLFLLVMAALMIPGGKLSDKYGRKRCFLIGLVVYG